MKKLLLLVCFLFFLCSAACGGPAVQNEPFASQGPQIYLDASYSTSQRVADLISRMSLADKAGQMVLGAQDINTGEDISDEDIISLGLGAVISGGGMVPGGVNTAADWKKAIDGFQSAALSRELKIPVFYGSDAVHGHNNAYGAVIFPHNIGLGAANDAELTERMGKYVAEEMKLTGVLWNFAPCVAVAQDPRWGRTYESFSSDPGIVCDLASAYLKGQQSAGVIATAKHFAGDGGTEFGTGDGTAGGNYLLDRGDCRLSEEDFKALHLAPYKRLVDEGALCVMVSFTSYNGIKMHENKYLITDILKGELGFKGFVVTDWGGLWGIDAPTYEAKVEACVNAGIDMLMEVNSYNEAAAAIIKGAQSGAIPEERINDAVSRILTVKFDMGLFEDPYSKDMSITAENLGSEEGRTLARKLAAKSQVLLKDEKGLLPLKRGQKIYVTGPAADSVGVQCGGWTLSWQGSAEKDFVPGTSILEGLQGCSGEYGIEIITDEARAKEADVVLLALGEQPYSEYMGDDAYISLTEEKALEGNADAIFEVQSLKKPVITLIVAGRNVMIDKYIGGWDAAVMCYLPGTEGGGVADVLVGKEPFSGKLPMPWYKSAADIGAQDPGLLFELGYGLTTGK